MTEFLVVLSCVAHLSKCPIPNGYNTQLKAASKEQCERDAKRLAKPYAAIMGYAAADFTIQCRHK